MFLVIQTIFQNKTEATEIIKTLMGKKYVNTGKNYIWRRL